jgi:hypothetical protein
MKSAERVDKDWREATERRCSGIAEEFSKGILLKASTL